MESKTGTRPSIERQRRVAPCAGAADRRCADTRVSGTRSSVQARLDAREHRLDRGHTPFDRWLIEAKHKTLISATEQDVSEYLTVSMSCIKAFYGFLVSAGCRDDDPTKAARKPRKRRQRS